MRGFFALEPERHAERRQLHDDPSRRRGVDLGTCLVDHLDADGSDRDGR